MKYVYGNAELPCNDKEDFKTNNVSLDIIWRLYLKEAPDKEHEEKAKQEDGDCYDKTCFFIECVAGKNDPDGEILTSGWLLYYIKENGNLIEFGYVEDVPDDAWDYFLKEIEK